MISWIMHLHWEFYPWEYHNQNKYPGQEVYTELIWLRAMVWGREQTAITVLTQLNNWYYPKISKGRDTKGNTLLEWFGIDKIVEKNFKPPSLTRTVLAMEAFMSSSSHWNLAQAVTCILSEFIFGGCLFKCKDYYTEHKDVNCLSNLQWIKAQLHHLFV